MFETEHLKSPPAPSKSQQKGKIARLDMLRGIAILVVFLYSWRNNTACRKYCPTSSWCIT